MRFAFFGDVMGRAGRNACEKYIPRLREDLKLDAVIVNGENAAGGFGINEKTANQLFNAGADVITLGNHSFDQAEALSYIEREPRLLRPVNYPRGVMPGKGANLYDVSGYNILVVNVQGRVFMDALDDPFVAVAEQLDAAPLGVVADMVLIDMHAEATSEKMAMGHFCDGRASLVVGTHQHIPTADCQILDGGTAYQTDAGMCGDYNSVIGMEADEPVNRFVTRRRTGQFKPAMGPATMCGVFVETDNATGLAIHVAPIRIGGRLSEAIPTF